MLRHLLRVLAGAMLVLAVPVQGFASVSGGICMALGHHGDAAPAHDHGAGDAAHHHDEDGSPSDNHSDGGHCAPCAACCAAAAIAAFTVPLVPDRTVGLLVPAPLASFHGIAPDRLDRPPLVL